MQVTLIAHTKLVANIPGYVSHDPENKPTDVDDLGEQAGRLCYLSWHRPNPETATNQGYMCNIIDHQHFSVSEHGSATFFVEGVTRNLTHELIRHRHLSYSEVSQRYVDVGAFSFVPHPGIQTLDDHQAESDLADAIDAGRRAYRSLMRAFSLKGKSRKESRQAARHALVSGTETKILVSGNMRGWRDSMYKRTQPGVDEEFLLVARQILKHLKVIAPNTFQDFK
jgi:thymidylate synthase (FAD)